MLALCRLLLSNHELIFTPLAFFSNSDHILISRRAVAKIGEKNTCPILNFLHLCSA